ncbi:MAG: NHLP bacteriocin export ABC transporter permease/ATPase subunit [Candidatus Paraimprobicoccus trichonymphae]|uniref:NHLP bacteriocin export ABC transporter permease/ATPase subunit n=1 Tax=Candidatus Paraimprobicoccus trichonymphae TaxID=3033793 RepID=A0AA48HXB6_9FIRM|nr:MAG: NHLP bacteriocin export ABC transporter permease/ATPase subunit [Candidatus Paraimprobicoccus trichonymphae]
MEVDIFESQINKRRKYDEEMYQDAFADLLSVLNIKGTKVVREVRGAIEEILRYLGKVIPEVPESVTELDAQLEYMLRPSGTMKRRIELVDNWWEDCTGCILGSTKFGEAIAIIPDKWSGYSYKNRNGKIIKINKEAAKNINTSGFCFYRSFPLKKLKIKDLLVFMLKTLSVSDVILLLSFACVLQLLSMISPEITNLIYGTIIPSDSLNLLFPMTFLLLGTTIGNLLLNLNKNIVDYKFDSKLTLSVNSAIIMRMFSLPAAFFRNFSAGELASRLSYISNLCQMLTKAVLSTGLTVAFSFGYIFQMYRFAPSLLIPGMILILITISFSILVTMLQQQIYTKKMKLSPKLQSLIYSLFGGMQKIKVTGAEKRAFAKWAEQYSEIEKLTYSPMFILKINSVISNIVYFGGIMVIYYFGAKNSVTLAEFASFNIAYASIRSAILGLCNLALKLANLGPILEMIKPVLEAEPEISENKKIITSLAGDIQVDKIKFRYSKESPLILDNISVKIKKGEYVAIVGKTGCGKSTLLRILLGFEKPEQGAIYYGNRDINNLDLRSLRQKIGVVTQNGSLFSGDIFSNIIITSPWKTLNDAWEAAEMAGIKKDIEEMPMKMHTLISEGSGGISGGQKQRLMIARAVISKPSILFLDEATSALDNITQSHVAEGISKLNCTRLVIAHRISTIKKCDRILVLDQGKISEEGTFEKLMKDKKLFYELAVRQLIN